MWKRYLERLCKSYSVRSHMAMVQSDMRIAASKRNPLSIAYADYMN